MKSVAVTGASGLVGAALCHKLETEGIAGAQGVKIVRLVRRPVQSADEIQWDPESGITDPQRERLEGVDALVHLAGESVFGRWTDEKKARIRDSRVKGTEVLSRALAQMKSPPSVWVSASAIGYYGDRGDESLNEQSSAGEGFLADVCKQWEAAAVAPAGTRVVNVRVGIVLAGGAGALKQMVPPFKLGLGGRVGHGRQFFSWIVLEDLVAAIVHCLSHQSVSGPVNGVAPQPVTNKEFTRELGKALGRPTFLPVPAAALRLRFGEFAQELLSSQRIEPQALLESGFSFTYPALPAAFRALEL